MKRFYAILTILFFLMIIPQAVFGDDTAIYDVISLDIDPNVLIVFDTSGSMETVDVCAPYSASTTYSGSYTAGIVYWYNPGTSSYEEFVSSTSILNCEWMRTELEDDGGASGNIEGAAGSYICSGDSSDWKKLRLGNFLNYESATTCATYITRMQAMKYAIAGTNGILNDPKYANIRFGLMTFTYDDGGVLSAECGTAHATIAATINGITGDGYTPLAETLYDAGKYFAGETDWISGTRNYTSPIDIACRPNYVIVTTDGLPRRDQDCVLGSVIGDYDNDSSTGENDLPCGVSNDSEAPYSDYLDDVAKYLYDTDLMPNWPAEGDSGYGKFDDQNIRTYTIGLGLGDQILIDAANNGTGRTNGSGFYLANNTSGLSNAFEDILSDIEQIDATFVAPVVPVSRTNRTLAGNALYVGLFQPTSTGRWNGNVKKFRLTKDGDLVEPDGETLLADDGYSYWFSDSCSETNDSACGSGGADGWNVIQGGAGGEMLVQATGSGRSLYTYSNFSSSFDLTDSNNSFSTSNTNLTNSVMGFASGETAQKIALIENILGSAGSTWVMGDVVHSRPQVVHYGTETPATSDDASYIFASTNGGVMHCIKDSDGNENWGFIPGNHLDRLNRLTDENLAHEFFVDGAPAVYEDAAQKIILFGERRGGSNYSALNITDPNVPEWKYEITDTILGSGETLGQSWCTPKLGNIKTSTTTSEMVFFLGGGYDVNQDSGSPVGNDSLGRAVFSVSAETGSVTGLNVNNGNYSQMTHGIVDVTAIDTTGDGYVNRVYAGDMGGQVFAIEDDDKDGGWNPRKLFVAKALGESTLTRKIFYAPDVVRESFGDFVFFGTGDRADPNDEAGAIVTNRVYAVKNNWDTSFTDGADTMDETDLYDATENWIQEGGETEQALATEGLASESGWFIKLENSGEKVVSEMVVFAGVIYFTTYQPQTPAATTDCDLIRGAGIARLYALDYKTGAAVYDWNLNIDADGNEITTPVKEDRSIQIGTTIPSAPVIAILEGGPQLFVAAGGGGGGGGGGGDGPDCTGPLCKFEPKRKFDMHLFYWWQQLSN